MLYINILERIYIKIITWISGWIKIFVQNFSFLIILWGYLIKSCSQNFKCVWVSGTKDQVHSHKKVQINWFIAKSVCPKIFSTNCQELNYWIMNHVLLPWEQIIRVSGCCDVFYHTILLKIFHFFSCCIHRI